MQQSTFSLSSQRWSTQTAVSAILELIGKAYWCIHWDAYVYIYHKGTQGGNSHKFQMFRQTLAAFISEFGEPGRTLEKRMSEHKNAVKKHETKNSTAVHSWTKQHQVDCEAAKTIEVEGNYWRRWVLEALHIHQQQQTSNLDCGLAINPSWLPVLNQPSPP